MSSMPRVVITLLLLLLAPAALAQPATCVVDLDAGTFTWHLPDRSQLAPVLVDDATARFASLDSLLALGEDAAALRDALGAAVFAPILEQLADFTELRFQPATVEPVPGRLASVGALNHPAGSPVFLTHGVSLCWPAPLRIPATRTMPDSGELLISAPFSEGVQPAQDDPDTLREALSKAVQKVRLIPRNELQSSTLRRALEENSPALWWFRGGEGTVAGLHPAFGVLPSIVVWSLPSHTRSGPPGLSPSTFASGGLGPGCVVVSTRAILETDLVHLARPFCDALGQGEACGAALVAAQRSAWSEGQPIGTATSLIAVGDPSIRGTLRRSSWFRRIRG